jgi:hypothetical protein
MTKGRTPTDPMDYLVLGAVVAAVAGGLIALAATSGSTLALLGGVVLGAVGGLVLLIGAVGVGTKLGLAHHEWTRPTAPREHSRP